MIINKLQQRCDIKFNQFMQNQIKKVVFLQSINQIIP